MSRADIRNWSQEGRRAEPNNEPRTKSETSGSVNAASKGGPRPCPQAWLSGQSKDQVNQCFASSPAVLRSSRPSRRSISVLQDVLVVGQKNRYVATDLPSGVWRRSCRSQGTKDEPVEFRCGTEERKHEATIWNVPKLSVELEHGGCLVMSHGRLRWSKKTKRWAKIT